MSYKQSLNYYVALTSLKVGVIRLTGNTFRSGNLTAKEGFQHVFLKGTKASVVV